MNMFNKFEVVERTGIGGSLPQCCFAGHIFSDRHCGAVCHGVFSGSGCKVQSVQTLGGQPCTMKSQKSADFHSI